MDNIPDLSYDSIDRLETDSSRIEDTDVSDVHNSFNRESIRHFKTKWDAILDKYSKIDDAKESDEIDLNTGAIVTDNGHLRNLKSVVEFRGVPVLSDIWSSDIEERELRQQRDERKRKQLKRNMKERMKETNMFCASDLSPEKRSNCLEDNMRLVSPSPTKRAKRSPSKEFFNNSDSESELDSPTKPRRSSYITRKAKPFASDSPLAAKHSRSSSPHPKHYKTAHRSKEHRRMVSSSSTEEMEESQPISSDEDFDDGYLVVADDSIIEDHQIIKCAFPSCAYCSSNRLLYQKHLLECHSRMLRAIGYPVSNSEKQEETTIDDNTITSLEEFFPLVHRVPPLPLTSNCLPVPCSQLINGRKCRRTFISEGHLTMHEQAAPQQCSSRKQVYLCPMLGCGYMVEGNYLEFRQHFIDAEHHIVPKYRRNFQKEICSDTKSSISKIIAKEQVDSIVNFELSEGRTQMTLGAMDTGYESIDELFSN